MRWLSLKNGLFVLGMMLLFNRAWAQIPDIHQLNNKIALIKASLSAQTNKRDQYLASLKDAETAAGQAALKLKNTTLSLQEQQAVLTKLNNSARTYQDQLLLQQNQLMKQIRSAYLLGREPYLKLILNQSDMDHLNRLLVYYRYLNQDRVDIIRDLQQTLTHLQTTEQEISRQTMVLKQLQLSQLESQKKLEQLKMNRQLSVSALNQTIQTNNEKLTTLLDNKHLLEQTLDRLEAKDQKRPEVPTGNFAAEKGKLLWPSSGKVLPYFGANIDGSELKWDGILIQAAEDQPVYSVANGQVVFAKWMPSYGLLLIINHGHGYMTLYGRNHYLYKKAGDNVKTGDLIATVGKSGGYGDSALYFAIRHNAIPLNPLAWCHGK